MRKQNQKTRFAGAASFVVAAVFALTLISWPLTEETTPPDSVAHPNADAAHSSANPDAADLTAAAALAKLPVKGRAPKDGYARTEFGPRWADVDRNGCDTRNDILRRDMHGTTVDPRNNCTVLAGTLDEPYGGVPIVAENRRTISNQIQIDHVVALADAWQKGAQELTAKQRIEFANDPMNLLAVEAKWNSQKGAGDAATWLPKNKAFRCKYVALQVGVKYKYQLWVTAAEKTAIQQVLAKCPDQRLPTSH
ncbi:MAG: HNH endonuclease family protein [Trueperella sp.]|nr:HNH endonuclease family protein [Trueperella sp.]